MNNLMIKIFPLSLILFYGCVTSTVITPSYIYERSEIEFSELKTIEIELEKITVFYFSIEPEVLIQNGQEVPTGRSKRTFLGMKVDPLQLLHKTYPGHDSALHPVVKMEKNIVIPMLFSKIKLTITGHMGNYSGT